MDETITYFETITKELHEHVQLMFENRPLFVLFEQILGCNSKLDHQNAKNVYPIYEKQFMNLLEAYLRKAKTKITEVFNNELEAYNEMLKAKDAEVDKAMLDV